MQIIQTHTHISQDTYETIIHQAYANHTTTHEHHTKHENSFKTHENHTTHEKHTATYE